MWVLRRIVSSHARGCAAVEPVDRAEGADQRVLHQVLRVGVVARERARHAQQHFDLGQHVLLERVPGSLPAVVTRQGTR